MLISSIISRPMLSSGSLGCGRAIIGGFRWLNIRSLSTNVEDPANPPLKNPPNPLEDLNNPHHHNNIQNHPHPENDHHHQNHHPQNNPQNHPQNSTTIPEWRKRDISLTARYGKWNPTRKVSRENMDNIREMKQQMPELTTKNIADRFGISPEAIRRILKSKWEPSEDRLIKLKERATAIKEESYLRKLRTNMIVDRQETQAQNATTIPWNEWKLTQRDKDHTKTKNTNNRKIMNSNVIMNNATNVYKYNNSMNMDPTKKNKGIKKYNTKKGIDMVKSITPVIKYDSRKPSSAYNPHKKRKPKRNPRVNIHTTLSGIID